MGRAERTESKAQSYRKDPSYKMADDLKGRRGRMEGQGIREAAAQEKQDAQDLFDKAFGPPEEKKDDEKKGKREKKRTKKKKGDKASE
jgi:hypothetical protein